MLNRKNGPAVWSPRAQCDKKAYQLRMKFICERQPRLDVRQDQVVGVLHRKQQVYGVRTALGVDYHSQTVVLTTGTFLRGSMHVGQSQQSGGRAGEPAAMSLSASLAEIGLRLGRLKTGTPPRLFRRDIDFSRMELQPGDEPVPFFTFWKNDLFHMEHSDCGLEFPTPANSKYPPGSRLHRVGGQVPCHTTYTTPRTAELIRTNLHRSPLYAGIITGVGPRYCPSIEDKIVKFPNKDRHQVFIEPEGAETDEIYVNGLSTCLPLDVQVALVRTIIGCENARLFRPAYAVEYDFAEPTQLLHSLETKACKNIYLAGQINGTSGYEEAAAQGIVAGINAARRVQNLDPVILQRSQAYIGVLLDDLVTKGTSEPYRMFT
ncbi:MAG: FAD-dependent oxidoreductase, partial [Bacteroidota bacterium]